MNPGSNQPTGNQPGQGGRHNRRRRPRRGGPDQQNRNQPQGHPGQQPRQNAQGGQGQGQQQGGQNRQRRRPGGGGGRTFTGPMDHSYRNGQGNENGAGGGGNRGRMGRRQQPQMQRFFQQPEIEPLSAQDTSVQPKIFAFVDDLFFLAKIQETARKLNIKVDFIKSEKDVLDALEQDGSTKPALIIFDLNSTSSKPLQAIHKLKTKLKRETSFIGFLSHLQGDLKLKAIEAGCDMVVPRSAFSQNLPQILRRHAASEEPENDSQPINF